MPYIRESEKTHIWLPLTVVGVLRDAATEIERRFIGPYEDEKRKQNGEVFQEIIEAFKRKNNG